MEVNSGFVTFRSPVVGGYAGLLVTGFESSGNIAEWMLSTGENPKGRIQQICGFESDMPPKVQDKNSDNVNISPAMTASEEQDGLHDLALSAAPDIRGIFRYLGISEEDCNEHLGLCADAWTTDITIA